MAAVLKRDPRLAPIKVQFDPRRSTVIVSGEVIDSAARRGADERLKSIWWVAAVENRLTTPTIGNGMLARIDKPAEAPRTINQLGSLIDIAPYTVRWVNPLPVSGSEWWVNLYVPGGGHVAYVMGEPRTARNATLDFALDRAKLRTAGLGPNGVASVALSLGGAAPTPQDPRVVSNVAAVRVADQ
jgi:hypothetical protein